jgi:hypothetical protein
VVRGYVSEMNHDTKTCQVVLCHEENKITVNYDRYESEILAAFNDYLKKGVAIQVSGTGIFSVQNNRLQKMKSISDIRLLEPLDVSVQIDELKKLRDCWFDEESQAPSHEALNWFIQIFDTYCVDSLPSPYIYPTYEGGIRMEWSIGSWELSLDVNLASHRGYWHALNTGNSQAEDKDLNLENEEGWNFLIQQVKTKA